ncbi:MAG: hypothetical protein WKF43_06970 [Acidimicrobiales bacterium]
MRIHTPSLSVEGDRANVTVTVESARGAFAPTAISIGVPRTWAGRLDLSATPWVPVAATLAAVLDEDVTFDAPADPVTLRAAAAATELMASWWGWGRPHLWADPVPTVSGEQGRGHGLFFTRGLDSWASFLTLRDDPDERHVTHLLSLFGVNRYRTPAAEAAVRQGAHDAATAVGVDLIDIDSDVRVLLDPFASWELVHGAVLTSCGLLLGSVLDRLTIASSWMTGERPSWGSHGDLDGLWRTGQVEVVHHLADLDRVQKAAVVAREQAALDSLLVCWEGAEASNCGACPKCLRTMTCLELVGALERCPTFDRPLTAVAVSGLADGVPHLDSREFVVQLLGHLDPDDELTQAWRRHLDDSGSKLPAFDASTTPMTGPGLRLRVDRDLSPSAVGPVVIGWERDMIPLRPRACERRSILTAVALNGRRSIGWILAEPADPLGIGDPSTAALADRAETGWGPGLCYLAGIVWAHDPSPILPPAVVGRMLDRSRVRVWWRADGTLDPLRVIESVEHGCLPVQVMPGPEAALLRRRLPDALAGLVVDIDVLTSIDPWDCGDLLDRAASWVLRGSAERDLGGTAEQWPRAGLHG